MIQDNQMPERFRNVVDDQISLYKKGRSIEVVESIPDTTDIPIEDPSVWLRIPNVICVFVDLLGSTKLSAEVNDKATAGAYQLFTGTAVKMFSEFEAPYIDVRGDGAFALFNENQPYRAIAAAVSFKTFADEGCIPLLKNDTKVEDIGTHIGIDQKTVLVRKIGLKRVGGRTDRQNEVWAGKPVNMAAKLAALSKDKQLIVSDRFYSNIQNDLVKYSCGCSNGVPSNNKQLLWEPLDVRAQGTFDFEYAYSLKSIWCGIHGRQYCEDILKLDDND